MHKNSGSLLKLLTVMAESVRAHALRVLYLQTSFAVVELELLRWLQALEEDVEPAWNISPAFFADIGDLLTLLTEQRVQDRYEQRVVDLPADSGAFRRRTQEHLFQQHRDFRLPLLHLPLELGVLRFHRTVRG